MSTIDQQFVEYIVKSLVSKPEAVQITRSIDEKGVLLELTVDPEDLGRVIGKRGATAQSIRSLLRALGTKNDARYNLKIVDNGAPHEYSSSSQSSYAQPTNDSNGDNQQSDTTFEEESAEEVVEEDHNSLANKTRRELEDLDDLEV